MKRYAVVPVVVAVSLLWFSGCSGAGAGGGGGGGGSGSSLPPYAHPEPIESTRSISVTTDFTNAGGGDYYHRVPITNTTVELELEDVPGGSQLYFVFTNTTNTATSTPKAGARSSVGVASVPPYNGTPARSAYEPIATPGPGAPEVTAFNRAPLESKAAAGPSPRRMPKPAANGTQRSLTVGDGYTFVVDLDGNTVDAKLRHQAADGDGTTLRLWVADNAWHEGGTRDYLVDEEMVANMAAQFLTSGANNDIYDWVTGIYGEPWGAEAETYSYLIPNDPQTVIEILLFDVDGDNQGGTLGYFWAKDNFLNDADFSASNERLMFYMDSVYYADGGDGNWALTDYYPSMQISTLAHELQHMIHFYQKAVVETADGVDIGLTSDVWINEMLSLMAEDFVSERFQDAGLDIRGPRGVIGSSEGPWNNTYGRLPGFNLYADWPLTIWYGDPVDYSVSYAFGAYLARNFGGADLMRSILGSPHVDEAAITDALGEQGSSLAFEDVLRLHPVSVLLSDNESEPSDVTLNLADASAWFDAGGSPAMQLGQIDHYHYDVPSVSFFGPWVWESTAAAYSWFENEHLPGMSLYVDALADGVSTRTWKITLPDGVYLTVVAKS